MGELTVQLSDGAFPPETLQALKLRCLESLYVFAKGVLGYDRLNERIHKPLCRLLEDYENNTRLRIVLPRGWYKTTLISIAYPIWRTCRNPEIRTLVTQNTHTNAIGKLGSIDAHFRRNELFKALFPELLPDASCTWTKEKMCVKRKSMFPESTFEAAGIRTQITSRHYDLIIQDDTVAPDLDELGEENLSPTKDDIDQAIGYHRLVTPLLTSPEKDQIVVVGTRWFEKDLLSWIGEREPQYKSYVRSCREDEHGQSDERGEPTFPEEFGPKALEGLEASMGPYMFSCLYLNKPIRTGDMTFQPDWWQYYDKPPSDLVTYTSVDPAPPPGEDGGDTDYNVVATCGKGLISGNVHLLDYYRQRCNPNELIDAVVDHIKKYKPVKLRIESVAYQASLIYWIKERLKAENLFVIVEPVTHGRKSKAQRIQGLQPMIKAGTFRIRNHHGEFRREAEAFPYGRHDDIIDCVAMQIPMWALTRTAKPSKESEIYDPHSFEGAVELLKAERLEKQDQGVLMEPFTIKKSHYALS